MGRGQGGRQRGANTAPPFVTLATRLLSLGLGVQSWQVGEETPLGKCGRPNGMARAQRRCLRLVLGGKGLKQ